MFAYSKNWYKCNSRSGKKVLSLSTTSRWVCKIQSILWAFITINFAKYLYEFHLIIWANQYQKSAITTTRHIVHMVCWIDREPKYFIIVIPIVKKLWSSVPFTMKNITKPMGVPNYSIQIISHGIGSNGSEIIFVLLFPIPFLVRLWIKLSIAVTLSLFEREEYSNIPKKVVPPLTG